MLYEWHTGVVGARRLNGVVCSEWGKEESLSVLLMFDEEYLPSREVGICAVRASVSKPLFCIKCVPKECC